MRRRFGAISKGMRVRQAVEVLFGQFKTSDDEAKAWARRMFRLPAPSDREIRGAVLEAIKFS